MNNQLQEEMNVLVTGGAGFIGSHFVPIRKIFANLSHERFIYIV
jgi:UDP-glucose 4-epimerase